MELTRLTKNIQNLPIELISIIISYSYSPQPIEITKDILSYFESKSIIQGLFYMRYKDLMPYERNVDMNWLVSDILCFMNHNRAAFYTLEHLSSHNKVLKKIFKVGSFHTLVKFVYSNSVLVLDYFLYINNLVFLIYLLLFLLFCRYLMNHYGLYSINYNRSYSVVVHEPIVIHLSFYLGVVLL